MATRVSEEGKSSGARLSSDETIKERRAESEKPAPTNKFMKTWHKAALIIIVIVGVLISVKSCVDRKPPDITMAYIGDGFLDREAFEENKDIVLNSVASDINGDGEFNADMMEISFNESLTEADRQNSGRKLTNALGAGVARIYFIEGKYLMNNASSGVFEDISRFGDGFKNASGEVVGIAITGNEVAESLGVDTKGDIYLAVRVVSEIDALTDKNIEKKHALAMDIAEYILN